MTKIEPAHRPGSLFIVSGPSGAGKSSLVDTVLNRLKDRYDIERFLTYTSRLPRAGEVDGKDFHFISPSIFESKMVAGEFLETSDALGTYYGTHREVGERLAAGQSGFLVIDRQGATKLRTVFTDAVLIWITVSSIEALKDRLQKRNTETGEQIERRLQRGALEMAAEADFPMYQSCILNEEFEVAALELAALVEAKLKEIKVF